MCGRITATNPDFEELREIGFDVDPFLPDWWEPRYNAAPGQRLVIGCGVAGARPVLRAGLWGVPATIDGRVKELVNLKSEKASSTMRWLGLVRAVVIADGFYEWGDVKGYRTPIRFHLPGGGLFAFGALVLPANDGGVDRFALLTREPGPVVAPVHDREPVILRRESAAGWVRGEGGIEGERVGLVATEASREVGRVENEGPHLLIPGPAKVAAKGKAPGGQLGFGF